MGDVPIAAFGMVMGVVGSVPPAFLFEQALRDARFVSVASGLASIMASFSMLSVAIFAIWLTAPQKVLFFGIGLVASFLLVWAVEAWRAWCAAQRYAGPGERK